MTFYYLVFLKVMDFSQQIIILYCLFKSTSWACSTYAQSKQNVSLFLWVCTQIIWACSKQNDYLVSFNLPSCEVSTDGIKPSRLESHEKRKTNKQQEHYYLLHIAEICSPFVKLQISDSPKPTTTTSLPLPNGQENSAQLIHGVLV